MLVVMGTCVSGFNARTLAAPSAPLTPSLLPQRALGDFDKDGLLDVARIGRDDHGVACISIQLSGSRRIVHLEVTVAAVVEGDIDHDGDLDLVASTPSGELLIWLNDGHGGFTRELPSPSPCVSDQPVLASVVLHEPVALGVVQHLVIRVDRLEAAVVSTRIRPPTTSRACDLAFLLLQPSRAPPARSA